MGFLVGSLTMFGVGTLGTFSDAKVPVLSTLAALPSGSGQSDTPAPVSYTHLTLPTTPYV